MEFDWIIPVANVAIYALAIWVISAILRLNRVKSLIAAVLGVLLANFVTPLIPDFLSLGGYLNLVVMILCVTLIACLLGRGRFKSLLSAILGVVLGNFLNSLVMPLLQNLIG